MVRFVITAFFIGALMTNVSQAAEVKKLSTPIQIPPSDEAVLMIKDSAGKTILTMKQLENFPMYETHMKTLWTPASTWVGIKLVDLLSAYGALSSERFIFRATNEYSIRLKRADIEAGDPIVATRINGMPIDPENKGPLFLIWPKVAEEVMSGTVAESDWIWSLNKIEVIR
ncbi:molybdopterin-dependent oxidoreductase [Azospirillum picis]|uniref:Oxidoreductase molybdopterin-binding domain-containing protein n=1 Tax=Azospirillum picis TaxID=488438 RepID=A0ABU0MFW8_9PROT|nr:molybdopterin-dependent oxidoreductase [Azospirillum picis]MBP2298637.1 hypothetical protein [Azospirillum picis]MDQ0532314.1 hypothetical protein [Azospirillum picis]